MQTVRFVFGVHNHQPVGNFDHVFRDHVNEVYLPFLSALAERDFLPIALHISGPLLEWLDRHDNAYLDLVGRLAADGRLELLASGLYEPILASLPNIDRIEQVEWMRDALKSRFGVEATGLWLTERVWEPALAADLVDAHVEYLLIDDRHFYASGFEPGQLHWPFRTESNCKPLTLLPIDERLRYLVPFQPPSATAEYLRGLGANGAPLAVLADDGEKFGGWPGTREWVYERGWLVSFIETMQQLVASGEVKLVTPSQAIREVESGGLAYLPTTSYREMEEWSLPATAAMRLHRLIAELGDERMHGPEGAIVRGGHWRHFLVKYSEANRMHKKMCCLSKLCRERGNPPDARREIGRAQCNDAYWHGVFGGLYLPHLREAVWGHLARAEAILRDHEPIQYRAYDLDGDGHEEISIHSGRFAAIVSPRRGGAVEEYTLFDSHTNFANVLTRTIEAYHWIAVESAALAADPNRATQNSREPELGLAVTEMPPQDRHPRALFMDRVLSADLREDTYAGGRFESLAGWEAARFLVDGITAEPDHVRVRLVPADDRRLALKELTFADDGTLTVRYEWRPHELPDASWFTTEISVVRALAVETEPAAERWQHAIATVAKSERGLEETVQGLSLTFRWPVSLGAATVRLAPHVPTSGSEAEK